MPRSTHTPHTTHKLANMYPRANKGWETPLTLANRNQAASEVGPAHAHAGQQQQRQRSEKTPVYSYHLNPYWSYPHSNSPPHRSWVRWSSSSRCIPALLTRTCRYRSSGHRCPCRRRRRRRRRGWAGMHSPFLISECDSDAVFCFGVARSLAGWLAGCWLIAVCW